MRNGPSSSIGKHVKGREIKKLYEDMNNLYRWSVSQYLPTGDFHETELSKKNGRNV